MTKPRHTEPLRAPLSEIERLLRKHDFEVMAEFAEELLRLESKQDPAFFEKMLSNEVWGGAGAFWETLLGARRDEYGPNTLRDQRVFDQAVVRVGEELQRLGVADSRVQRRVQWLREGLRNSSSFPEMGG